MAGKDFSPFAELFETPLCNGLTKPKAVRGEGMKMVNMGEVFAHRRIHNLDMDRVPMDSRERGSSLLRDGDLLFARQSLVLSGAGKCVLFQGDKEGVTFESHIIRCRLDQRKAEPAFYFYLFQSQEGRSLIESILELVAAAGIRGSDLGRLTVPVPPLAEQKALAVVLGALDDKIELIRRMNATLEAMARARALFQSWFMDFDPVRASMERSGRQTERSEVNRDGRPPAALFPEHMENSPLDHIPKGWTVRTLSSVTKYLSRGIGPSYLPEVAIVDSHVTIVRPASDTDPFFLGINLSGREAEIEELGEGSTGQTELSRTRLGELKIITPPFDLQKAFGAAVGPLLMRIAENETQSRTLATLRDTLLPKLLSGELLLK